MELSTKPYLLRAIHDWCTDAGFTPYVAVAVDDTVRAPLEFVKNGEIVLNISALATNRLKLGNEAIEFQARFGGVAREVYVPIDRVVAIYARENGQGMAFDVPRVVVAETADAVPAAESPDAARERGTLVAVPASTEAGGDEPPPPSPAPRAPTDRPRLTRVK